MDENCGKKCDVFYEKKFEAVVNPMECLVDKFSEAKTEPSAKNLSDCDFIYNPRLVRYNDGYTDTFGIGESVIDMKKVESCTAK